MSLDWLCISIFTLICVSHVESHIYGEDIGSHSAWKLLDSYECGYSAPDRIIGGKNAVLGQFPWLVRLGYAVDGDSDLDYMCGGALVTDRHVLTAGHCVADDYALSQIRMGEYDSGTDPDCQLGVCAPTVQDRKIKKVITHDKFNKPRFHNDIALIVLDRPVQLNDYVTPICLPRGGMTNSLAIGELMTVAGWGKMNMTTEERARILQFVSVPIVQRNVCDSFGRGFTLSENEICAGAQKNRDACGGDSGGPLMKVYDTVDGPKNYIMGIVSFGPTICGIKKPGIYTSVPHFLKWILDNVMSY